jgi:hypothetical protein
MRIEKMADMCQKETSSRRDSNLPGGILDILDRLERIAEKMPSG